MYPASFEYHTPTTLAEAIALLGRYGDEAKVISGSQSLIPLMKLRLAPGGAPDRCVAHARGPGQVRAAAGEAAHGRGSGRPDRRRPGAQSGNHRWKPPAPRS